MSKGMTNRVIVPLSYRAMALSYCVIGLLAAPLVARAVHSVDRQQRDTQAAPAGSAVVSGFVTSDEATPQPIRRAQVTLTGSDQPVFKTTFTDAAGRFAVKDLPAGRYTLAATKGGYVRAAFGAKRHDRPGTPVNLAAGQQMAGLTLRMSRGGVIAGTVSDETGMPAAGAQVRVLQYRMQQGERVLMPATGGNAFGEVTDDRGAYRLYGLPPGEYLVSATPRNSNIGEIRASTDAEIRAALAALQQPIVPAPTAGQPLPPPREPVTVGFAPVYFSGTTSVTSAASVTLAAGEERGGVDFSLQLVRTAKIEGTVVVPAGFSPQNVQLTMVATGAQAAPGVLGSTFLNRVTPGADGKFSYAAIPPGQYTINARLSGSPPAGRGGGAPPETFEFVMAGGGRQVVSGGRPGSGTAYWATAEVTADGTTQSNITLALQPGMTVSGRLEFKGTRLAAPADLTRVRVTLSPAPSPGGFNVMASLPGAQVDASGRFTITGVTPGRYLVSGSAPAPAGGGPGIYWTLKSAMIKGRDVLDYPLEIGPGDDLNDAVVTFTDMAQTVSGALQDPSGRPAPDYTIIVFAADKQYWTPQARRIRSTRPGTDGRFTVTNLPAGDYRIAAVVDIAQGEANDPAFLELLVPASYAFTLAEGERKVQDLRIAGLPDRPL
jgi:hypothetical protein